MLVLTRKTGDKVVIDESIVVEVLEIQGNRVRIGIQAPRGVSILRQELQVSMGSETPKIEKAGAQLAVAS